LPYVVPYVPVRKTSVYLPEHLKRALAMRAAATGRSEAEVVRTAIEAEVRGGAPAPPADPPLPGRLVGVGVGPGDPDLLTVRAVAALRRADRVVAPATAVDAVGRAELIVRQAVPGVAIERLPFAMAPSRAERDRSVAGAARRVAELLDGGEVAFVTLGDPLTYSTFSSVAAAVRGLRPTATVEQVPGIMAFQALAARTGTVVTDEAERLVVRTALDGEDVGADLDDPRATVVLYKGGASTERWRASCWACRASVSAAWATWPPPGRRPTWPR
jgi:precorrin-2/cobalt-factor-2 C20-methyltransferase